MARLAHAADGALANFSRAGGENSNRPSGSGPMSQDSLGCCFLLNLDSSRAC